MRAGRLLVFASVLSMVSVAAPAFTRVEGEISPSDPFLQDSRGGMVGLGFGFGPWWGPYDAYAPPAYAYPPPVYSVPPPRLLRHGTQSRAACQEFHSTVIVNGQSRIAAGLACPQPDGTWRIVR